MSEVLLDPGGDSLATPSGELLVLPEGNLGRDPGGGALAAFRTFVPTSSPETRDIATLWSPDLGRGDWAVAGPALQDGGDLATAVLISLFTDRSANPGDVIPDGTTDRRGWWGDEGEDHPIGSRLWLLDRAKQTNETLARAKDYMAEALQWLIDDGVAASIDIYAEWTRRGTLGAQITVHQPGKSAPTTLSFAWAWQGIS